MQLLKNIISLIRKRTIAEKIGFFAIFTICVWWDMHGEVISGLTGEIKPNGLLLFLIYEFSAYFIIFGGKSDIEKNSKVSIPNIKDSDIIDAEVEEIDNK